MLAPYNAQVVLLRQHLAAAGLGDVRVGTVDKFQGAEAPVAIVSMTASSVEDIPRGIPFLLNRNRLNVAISRAQYAAVIVRAETLTDYLPAAPTRSGGAGRVPGPDRRPALRRERLAGRALRVAANAAVPGPHRTDGACRGAAGGDSRCGVRLGAAGARTRDRSLAPP